MRNLTEYNERQSRQWAFLVTLTLHLGLGILLYIGTSGKPSEKPTATQQTSAKSLTTNP